MRSHKMPHILTAFAFGAVGFLVGATIIANRLNRRIRRLQEQLAVARAERDRLAYEVRRFVGMSPLRAVDN